MSRNMKDRKIKALQPHFNLPTNAALLFLIIVNKKGGAKATL